MNRTAAHLQRLLGHLRVSSIPITPATSRKWLAASLVLVGLLALPNLRYPLGRDQATYCTIGRALLDGQQLYRDLWDNKPPGIFYIFALIVKAFGPVMWSVGVIDILWLLAISVFIFRFAERYLGVGGALISVVFHAIWHIWAGYWDAAQPEMFLLLFMFASYFLIAGKQSSPKLRHFSAGTLTAGAFWLKYNALAFLPFLLLLPYIDTGGLDAKPRCLKLTIPWRLWRLRIAFFLGGFLIAIALVLFGFWLSGSWDALREVQFEVLPRYAAMVPQRVRRYWFWALENTQYRVGFWTECVALAALVVAWLTNDLARVFPILFGAVSGYVLAVSQLRFPSFAFEGSYPFLAMVWAYIGCRVYSGCRALSRKLAQRGWRAAKVLVWVAFANVLYTPLPAIVDNHQIEGYKELLEWWRDPKRFYSYYPWADPISHFSDQMRVIDYLQENPAKEDKIFIWGSEPLIYFLTDHPPVTRFVSNFALISPWAPPRWREEFVHELKKDPPRYFIVARDDRVPYISFTYLDSEEHLKLFPKLSQFLRDFYHPVCNLKAFTIYRRIEPSPAGPVRVTAAPQSQW